MLGNYFATALSNLKRNWLYAAISIFGLAVSFAGAILVAQFVRAEFSYDRWIPGYNQIYKITSGIEQPGQAPLNSELIQPTASAELKQQFADGVVASARVMQDRPTIMQTPDTGDGGAIDEAFGWADPDYFRVFPLPVTGGELASALDQPDTVVMTQSAARKYFGREDVVGETLTIQQGTNKRSLKVTAILKDYPSNTMLFYEILASGRSANAQMARIDALPPAAMRTGYAVETFVRVKPEVTREKLQAAADILIKPYADAFGAAKIKTWFSTRPMADAHLSAQGMGLMAGKPTGSRSTAMAIATVGGLIVIVAVINFVTLMTARASRRAVEVGVRKANGASRGQLVVQFMGEALIYATLSMILAVAIASALAQPFSDFVQRGLTLDFVGDPILTAGLVGATLIIGILGGFYPALVLSSFRPGTVLKGGQVKAAGSPVTRQSLVVIQFAILIGLIISTITIYQQTRFALSQGFGKASDLIMQVTTNCGNASFLEEVRKLPGVERAGCSSMNALSVAAAKNLTVVTTKDGRQIPFDIAPVHFEFFETYDIKPIAGRLFERNRGAADNPALPQQTPPGQAPPAGQPPAPPPVFVSRPVIFNETAIRMLGYASPEEAIGKQVTWGQPGALAPTSSEIIGVIGDLPVSVNAEAAPAIYFIFNNALQVLSIRAKGDYDFASTVSDIQRVWKTTNNVRPLQLSFYAEQRRVLYLDIIIQGTLIGICAAAAIVIACLGLFALSAFAAERRTKEIGIRKALGATTSSVLGLLMWQFTIPVFVAIVIALPLGYWIMTQWLQNYTYRVDISPWTLVIAPLAALAVAWLTIFVQTYLVARAKPVKALRHE